MLMPDWERNNQFGKYSWNVCVVLSMVPVAGAAADVPNRILLCWLNDTERDKLAFVVVFGVCALVQKMS